MLIHFTKQDLEITIDNLEFGIFENKKYVSDNPLVNCSKLKKITKKEERLLNRLKKIDANLTTKKGK